MGRTKMSLHKKLTECVSTRLHELASGYLIFAYLRTLVHYCACKVHCESASLIGLLALDVLCLHVLNLNLKTWDLF